MKKVGIITIHKSTNYGACLQAHALWKFITLQGYNGFIIDLYRNIHEGFIPSKKYTIYEKPYIDQTQKSRLEVIKKPLRKIYNRLQNQIYSEARQKRKKRFDAFNAMSVYSEPYPCIDQLYETPPQYDIYITGSDQVWNPTIGIPLEPYFLTFTNSPNKISYASSFGVSALDDKYKILFQPWLSTYKMISVREKEGADLVKQIIDKQVPVCLDPTLLIGADYWKSIASQTEIKDPYILLFFIKGVTKQVLTYCTSIAKSKGYKIIILGETSLTCYMKYHTIADAGPREFISLIKNAKMVFTDSFHGFAFSIMLNDNFYILLDKAINGKSRNSRINTLLDALQLHDRILNFNNLKDFPSINRNKLNTSLKEMQENSAQYLINNLK